MEEHNVTKTRRQEKIELLKLALEHERAMKGLGRSDNFRSIYKDTLLLVDGVVWESMFMDTGPAKPAWEAELLNIFDGDEKAVKKFQKAVALAAFPDIVKKVFG